MISVTGSNPYTSQYLYSSANEAPQTDTVRQAAAKEPPGPDPFKPGDVKVSLSRQVQTARLREALGLNPTGALKLKDFTAVTETRGADVTQTLARTREALGIPESQKISLFLDDTSQLTVKETFPEKGQLLKALSNDAAFMTSFAQLAAASQVVDYTQSLASQKTNLADHMGDDLGWETAMNAASQYRAMSFRDSAFEDLLGISRLKTPFTFTHDPAPQVR